jgi:thioester reductase-like protein
MYLVTGATGFIGKHLVSALLARGQNVYVLVRRDSRARLQEIVAARWAAHADRVVPIVGDIAAPGCGLDAAATRKLKASVAHVFHLAAVYDMAADLDANRHANVDGTRHVVQLANTLRARLHYVSSIAVAGDYQGTFREDMYDEGQRHRHPYFQTKYEAEGVVRRECTAPYRIYRPGIVIGSAATGEADKIDGP